MNNNSNKIVILVAIFFIFVTGCLRSYIQTDEEYKEEVEKYIQEEIGLKEYKLSDTYKTKKGKDGYKDNIWTVEDENGITFHVIDDYLWGRESTSNVLKNDYDESIFKYYYDELEKKDNIIVSEDDSDTVYDFHLECDYANKSDLLNCYDSLKSYYDFYNSKGYSLETRYSFNPSLLGNKTLRFSSIYGYLDDINQDTIDKGLLEFYSFGVYFQVDSITSIMSSSDWDLVLNNPGAQKVVGTKYIASINCISLDTLYKLLTDNKYKLSGNQSRFIVYGKDGNKYEFSYDFIDSFESGNGTDTYNRYYYLKNDEKEYTFYDLDPNSINELLSLSISLESNK